MKEVSRQLVGAIEIASSSVVKEETRPHRKRSLMVELSRARAQVAFYEEMLRLEEAVEALKIVDVGEAGKEAGKEPDSGEEVIFMDTPASSQVTEGEGSSLSDRWIPMPRASFGPGGKAGRGGRG